MSTVWLGIQMEDDNFVPGGNYSPEVQALIKGLVEALGERRFRVCVKAQNLGEVDIFDTASVMEGHKAKNTLRILAAAVKEVM